MTRLLWRALALISVALGLIGAFLPVLPTVPFMLLAAWAAGRGWPEFERWLLAHPQWGPHIRQWREHGAVPRRAKLLAISMMSLSALVIAFSPMAPALRGGVLLILLLVAVWMWRRPER